MRLVSAPERQVPAPSLEAVIWRREDTRSLHLSVSIGNKNLRMWPLVFTFYHTKIKFSQAFLSLSDEDELGADPQATAAVYNLLRVEMWTSWCWSLPVWIPFHGWEHQKSSGDGKGPSSGWADSEQRELWHFATSPGEQGPGSKLCPGPRTSYNCTGSPETTRSKVSRDPKKWLITVLKVHDSVKRYQRDWRYRQHVANSPFSPGCWWRQISDGEPDLPLLCWNQSNHWFQEHRNAGSPYELLRRKKVSV